jgi:hypothetical protein
MADPTMSLQNRVTPEGDIISTPERGLMMGNRGGALHDGERRLRARRWVSRQWISCRLEFNGRKRTVMAPNRYTELFFLDEATALAAGHRPCFECRRQDALWFATLWARLRGREGRATAREMDDVLHRERVGPDGAKVVWQTTAEALPSGAMLRQAGRAFLVLSEKLLEWSPAGYVRLVPLMPGAPVDVLTPRSIVAVLSAGYCPMLHPSTSELL